MTKTNPNDCATGFQGKEVFVKGLTKREYFAALAMQGLLSAKGSYFPNQQNTGELAAWASVHYADALIAALNKEDLDE